jgi:hypothetical protein
MVPFEVCRGSGGMGMLSQVVKFRSSTVRALGHRYLLACSMQTGIRRICGEAFFGQGATQSGVCSEWFPQIGWSLRNGC